MGSYSPSFSRYTIGFCGGQLQDSVGRLRATDGINSLDEYNGFGQNLADTGWRYITLTYNGSVFDVYIDGVYSKSTDWIYGIADCSTSLYLGKNTWSNYMNGSLDDFRIYNRALTESEIKDLYNSHLQKVSDSNYVLEVNKTDLTAGQYNYTISLNDSDGVSTSGLKTFEYLGPQKVSFVSPPTPANLATIPTSNVTIKANLTDLLNVNIINFTFNSVTTSMLLNSDFGVGEYSFGPSDGLILYLPFEGGSLTDLSGQGNDATNNGATQTTGKLGDAYSFDGVNDYIGIANLIIPNDVTYVLWIKPSSLNNNRFLSQLGNDEVILV